MTLASIAPARSAAARVRPHHWRALVHVQANATLLFQIVGAGGCSKCRWSATGCGRCKRRRRRAVAGGDPDSECAACRYRGRGKKQAHTCGARGASARRAVGVAAAAILPAPAVPSLVHLVPAAEGRTRPGESAARPRRAPRKLDLGLGRGDRSWTDSASAQTVVLKYASRSSTSPAGLRAGLADVVAGQLPRMPRRHIDEVVAEHCTGAWVAVEEPSGAVVGGLVYRRADADVFEIAFLAVAESHRGRGLGVAMVARVLALAKKAGAKIVTHADETAVEYWRRAGFAETPIPKRLARWINHYDASVFMACTP